MSEEVNTINSYHRVDNIEVVGLPTPIDGESDEDLLLECLNSLPVEPVSSNGISICHEVPSRRKDKRVMVCKFVKRKSKIAVLKAKKENPQLFSAASQLKRDIGLKFVWSKNGVVYMRQNDESPIFKVNKENINNLRSNHNNIQFFQVVSLWRHFYVLR